MEVLSKEESTQEKYKNLTIKYITWILVFSYIPSLTEFKIVRYTYLTVALQTVQYILVNIWVQICEWFVNSSVACDDITVFVG